MRDEYFQYDKDRIYRKALPTGMFGSGAPYDITDHQPWILPGVDFDTNEPTVRGAVYDVLLFSRFFKVLYSCSSGRELVLTPFSFSHLFFLILLYLHHLIFISFFF